MCVLLRRRALALTNTAALCIGCGIFKAYVPLAAIAQAPRSTGYGRGLARTVGRCFTAAGSRLTRREACVRCLPSTSRRIPAPEGSATPRLN